MCLFVEKRFPKRAKEDIVCYKILIERAFPDYSLHSPLQLFDWELNKLMKARGKFKIFAGYDNLLGSRIIEGGYFHTLSDAEETKKEASSSQFYNVYKCIIPKGTLYFKGTYKGYVGYASKSLIVKEKVD